MRFRLALKNIALRPFRNLLAIISIAIGTGSLVIFMGLSEGIKQASFQEFENQNPLTQITVRPKSEDSSLLSFFSESDSPKLTQDTVNSILKIPKVKAIYPETQFTQFSSIEAELLGFTLESDVLIFGIEESFLQQDIPKNSWDKTAQPYPAVLPKKMLDLYNLGIATPRGLPHISEETVIGQRLKLYPGRSIFFPGSSKNEEAIELELVGLSDKVNLFGVTLPFQIVQQLNQQYTDSTPVNFTEIFVEANTAQDTPQIAQEIENSLDLSTQYFQKNIEEVQAKLNFLTIALSIISFIIIITASIAILSTFLSTASERTNELGLLRAIGAKKSHIKQLFLAESTTIGIIGSLLGISLGIASAKIVDSLNLAQVSAQVAFSTETLFKITPQLCLTAALFGTLLSVLAAYIPARKAANINPIEALNK